MDLCAYKYKIENPTEDISKVLMTTMMTKVGCNKFQP